MTSVHRSLAAFAAWLPGHRAGPHSDVSVRHEVARYCEFLGTAVPVTGDPLADENARDTAVEAYRAYLELFNTAAMPIGAVLQSVDHFYTFLGLGPVRAVSR